MFIRRLASRDLLVSETSNRRLNDLGSFSPNPGNLTGSLYMPNGQKTAVPLVVVLHGCTQFGEDYAASAGWLELAERENFAVLVPQQKRMNNMNLCFNWFQPGDMRRGGGEPASIYAMIEAVSNAHAIDRSRIYVTGLSAGAAMAGIMLATYPEVFAAGALIAGLPYGSATTVGSALRTMRKSPMQDPRALGKAVTDATNHEGPWPRMSVWHGSADSTVDRSNATATAAQWVEVHGLTGVLPRLESYSGCTRHIWGDDSRRPRVEFVEISGMGHGTPVDCSSSEPIGRAGPFLLDVGIASSECIADFWGLVSKRQIKGTGCLSERARKHTEIAPMAHPTAPQHVNQREITKVINDAFRAAGLL